MKLHPDVKISLSGGGSSNGIKAILDGTADIGNASRFIKSKEIKLASTKGIYPVPHRIAMDCIVPVVHSQNPVMDLTTAHIKDIYLGKIKNWNKMGGKDLKIVVISRDTSSGTFEVWENLVMESVVIGFFGMVVVAPFGSEHYHALFATGLVLFVFTFIFNLIADYISSRYRQVGEASL